MSEKITNLTEQASGTLHDDDLFVNVDVSDTTMAATGTTKRSKWSSLKAALKTYFDSLYATATQGGKADTAVQPGDLGGAAALNVGTTAGTVAAGDHTHGDATTLAAGFMAATDKSKLDGIEIGADVTDAGNVAAAIAGAAGKTTPVDADALPLIDSAASNALKQLTWANLKATLKSYFDSLYALATHTHAAGDITSGTLDAARLPAPTTTALGGVKRNTGTAGQFVTGIDSSGGLTYDTPGGGGGGKVVAIKHASSNARQSSSSTTWADITSLSITHTPASASNKVLLIASINGASNATNANLGMRFVRDSTAVGVGDNEATNRTAVGQAIMSPGTDAAGSLTHVFVDEPATTASATWKAQFAALQTSGVVYINRTSNDSNNVFSPRGLCTLTLIEFAP